MAFLLLGIDSLIAGLAIGPIVSKRARIPLAVLFGVADGVGFLIGSALDWNLSEAASSLTTGILVILGLYLIVVAVGTRRVTAGWPVWVVPWALTLDNLTYGGADQATSSVLTQAGPQILSSGLLALIGLSVGVALPRAIPRLRNRVVATRLAGVGLVVAAGALLIVG